MNEKEKNAIEGLKESIEMDKKIYPRSGVHIVIQSNELVPILDLIEKQQKEIEDLKEEQNWRAEELENRVHELNNYKYRAKKYYVSKSKIKSHIYDLEQKKDIEDSALYTYSECISATIESFKSILESEE